MISKYIIVEILSFVYNRDYIIKICRKLNKRMLIMTVNDKNIIDNICRD